MAKSQSLQDPFLNALRKEKVPVSIYLVNGIKLQPARLLAPSFLPRARAQRAHSGHGRGRGRGLDAIPWPREVVC